MSLYGEKKWLLGGTWKRRDFPRMTKIPEFLIYGLREQREAELPKLTLTPGGKVGQSTYPVRAGLD